MFTHTYFNRLTTNSYHNLCTKLTPPDGIGLLLGLGLKFCIQSRRPNNISIDNTINRFTRDIRLKYLFAGQEEENVHQKNTFNNKLYIKSDWQPPQAETDIENRIDNFKEELMNIRNSINSNTKTSTNLTTIQQNLLIAVRKNNNFVILITDKNLGPAIMEREVYIDRMLTEHLCDGKTYKQLTCLEADNILQDFKEDLHELLVYTHETSLEDHERIFFERGYKTCTRIPQFYGSPKVHKSMIPNIKFRPVNSNCGSLAAVASKYVDYYLQKLIKYTPSYINNSLHVIDKLKNLTITNELLITTSDAKSMYTNIDPEEGIDTIEKYLNQFGNECKTFIPKELIIDLLRLIMTKNVFQFGNTWWLQLIGTAMGTPCACAYATIFFAYHERTFLQEKYQDNLLLYIRFIDDILIIWKKSNNEANTFISFKKDLNDRCKLEWKTEDLSKSTNFLDLTITLKNNNFETKTYQKSMNLFLYIPEHSAHPPGLIKSLITGLLETYWRQNSQKKDFISTSRLLYERLLARGHKPDKLKIIFTKAAERLESKSKCNWKQDEIKQDKSRIFLHWPFHPKDVSRQQIRDSYENTCEVPNSNGDSFKRIITNRDEIFKISNITVAYSRSKNLRDMLSPTKLKETATINVQAALLRLNQNDRLMGSTR